MQLPAFIQRAVAFFDKAEANITDTANRLAVALAENGSYKTRIDALTADVSAKDAANKDLTAQVSTHVATISARDQEIVALKASQTDFDSKVQTAAAAKSAAIVAGVGVPPVKGQTPEDTVKGANEKPKATGLAAYQAAVKEQIKSQVNTSGK